MTLDCHVGSDLIGSIKSVEWKFNGEVNVLVYKSKDFSLDDQGAHFRDRASEGDSWDFDKGNLPLKIKSLQESDSGIYSCSVSTGEDPKGIISIKLNVKEGKPCFHCSTCIQIKTVFIGLLYITNNYKK